MHLELANRPPTPDLSADGLVLAFRSSPHLEVVGTMSAQLAGGRGSVVVEVLAASHRVHLLEGADTVATEQVACLGASPASPLPARATHEAGRHRLRFTASRPELGAEGLTRLASRLRTADGDRALVVSFPGHPDALTSVQVLDDGWETWHLYPGAAPHALRTRTRVSTR